eukprot:2838198-Amphidinium_carterae.1
MQLSRFVPRTGKPREQETLTEVLNININRSVSSFPMISTGLLAHCVHLSNVSKGTQSKGLQAYQSWRLTTACGNTVTVL